MPPAVSLIESPYPELPAAFHFAVYFGSLNSHDARFREVSGMSVELETETVVEGGENRFVHRLPKAIKHPNLVLKRGIASHESVLVTWCRETLEDGFAHGIRTKLVQVQLLDANAHPLRAWTFHDAYPVKWSVGELQSSKNEVALETIELVYNRMQKQR